MGQKITTEAKEQIIKKALNPGMNSLKEIALSNNIGYSTLERWLRGYRSSAGKGVQASGKSPGKSPTTRDLSRAEKLEHLFATASLDEAETGAYCRVHGLYKVHLTQWKEEFMKPVSLDEKQDLPHRENKILKAENQALKRDLHRKDKALAETAALLIMKKKADLIWGGVEDDLCLLP